MSEPPEYNRAEIMAISRKARREIFWILLLAACFSLTYILIFADGGYLEYRKAQNEFQELLRENQNLRQQQQLYMEKIRKLRNDPDEVERIARDRHGYAKPGDIILNLPGRTDSPSDRDPGSQ
jgi:cell division protein FtsB